MQPASTVPNQEENEAGVLVVTHSLVHKEHAFSSQTHQEGDDGEVCKGGGHDADASRPRRLFQSERKRSLII